MFGTGMILSDRRARSPIGRGVALRRHSVGVQVAPGTPLKNHITRDKHELPTRPVTHLARRPVCLTGERGSKPLRVAKFADRHAAEPDQGIAQSGRALASDARGRRIEACYPDQFAG